MVPPKVSWAWHSKRSLTISVNVGNIDRILRLVIGIVLILAPFVTSWGFVQSTTGTVISVVVGLVLVGTAAIKFCPLYHIFGIRTCQM